MTSCSQCSRLKLDSDSGGGADEADAYDRGNPIIMPSLCQTLPLSHAALRQKSRSCASTLCDFGTQAKDFGQINPHTECSLGHESLTKRNMILTHFILRHNRSLFIASVTMGVGSKG